MVWKQDLAKLKQAYREAGGSPPPSPPKPKPKLIEGKDLNDEDAMFLAAMGGSPQRPTIQAALVAAPVPVETPQSAEPAISFEESLGELKGLKPLQPRHPVSVSQVAAPIATVAPPVPSREASAPVTVVEHPEAVASVSPVPEAARSPLRIHLAAGMALEVDATLDLRGHSVPDALGRLRDRIEDGALLGWRTLHVHLGETPALHEALLGFLLDTPSPRIGRYAQAPIPMGGTQAWVLYY